MKVSNAEYVRGPVGGAENRFHLPLTRCPSPRTPTEACALSTFSPSQALRTRLTHQHRPREGPLVLGGALRSSPPRAGCAEGRWGEPVSSRSHRGQSPHQRGRPCPLGRRMEGTAFWSSLDSLQIPTVPQNIEMWSKGNLSRTKSKAFEIKRLKI